MVAHGQHDVDVVRRDLDLDRRARRRMHERVAHEVADDLAQLLRVAMDERGAVCRQLDWAVGRGGTCVGDRVAREPVHVDRLVGGLA